MAASPTSSCCTLPLISWRQMARCEPDGHRHCLHDAQLCGAVSFQKLPCFCSAQPSCKAQIAGIIGGKVRPCDPCSVHKMLQCTAELPALKINLTTHQLPGTNVLALRRDVCQFLRQATSLHMVFGIAVCCQSRSALVEQHLPGMHHMMSKDCKTWIRRAQACTSDSMTLCCGIHASCRLLQPGITLTLH